MYFGFIEPDNYANRYQSRNIPTEDDRWLGQNFPRWANPEKDRVLDDLFAAKVREPARQADFIVEFNRLFSNDLPILPIRYVVEPTAVRRGLVGPGPKYGDPGENSRSWNAHLWEWTE